MEDNTIIDMLEGEFTHVIYKSDNYMVSRFKTAEGTITVTGPSFDFERNEKYILTGTYVEHPRYGFQFAMLTVEKYVSTQADEIVSFLAGKSFPGVGKKAAKKIYDHFGSETLRLLKEDPQRIYELDLSEKQILSIISGFEAMNDPQNEIMLYLVSNGFNNAEAQKIFNRFKLATYEVGQDNPFRYYNEIYGISFDKVRRFAAKVNFEDMENKYREAYLIYLLTEYTFNSGDIYIMYDKLVQMLAYYGGMDNLDEIIERCIEKNYLYRQGERLYLYNDHYDEVYIAEYIRNFNSNMKLDDELIEEGIEERENELKISYHEKQKEAIKAFFKEDLSIVVGGPGTGKTTIVKAMADIFKEAFPFSNLIVVAPTGRAAKRINEICEVESKTIHSLLRWNKEDNSFVFNVENPILYDALIIDEFSMVDNNLFACLLKACSRVKKICIIGDNDQLPSIRPGNVLNDLIESGLIKVTELQFNYRQNEGNEIIKLANAIKNDEADLSDYDTDISFYDIDTDAFNVIDLIREDLNQGYSLDEIQVLTPMYKGEWGIDNLNLQLQAAFNPRGFNKAEKKAGKYLFRTGDKILQLKNRPSDDVYNGDIGILEEIDDKEKYLMVNYAGTYVFYQYEELNDIALAYAMSVHKSQGSEYQIVYFIFSRNNIHMLNRNLIYTAISRAKKRLVIIGKQELFTKGLAKAMKKRNTSLGELLKDEK
ncbi:MAG: ATP-dependent RecD-like DNA helicase [Erysipelotrichaceae bacterium]|nr:ATP-dependent RecD-like DNA helicase [Erysipelotrichaceae bacterium]